MSAYQTVVVGTDGSDSSLRAVDRAGQIAAGSNAKLVIATAYFPQSEDQRAAAVRWRHCAGRHSAGAARATCQPQSLN